MINFDDRSKALRIPCDRRHLGCVTRLCAGHAPDLKMAICCNPVLSSTRSSVPYILLFPITLETTEENQILDAILLCLKTNKLSHIELHHTTITNLIECKGGSMTGSFRLFTYFCAIKSPRRITLYGKTSEEKARLLLGIAQKGGGGGGLGKIS